jgi:hypothetical protein
MTKYNSVTGKQNSCFKLNCTHTVLQLINSKCNLLHYKQPDEQMLQSTLSLLAPYFLYVEFKTSFTEYKY